MRYFNNHYTCLLLLLFSLSCKKITDIPPDEAQKRPTTLNDCQALLDNDRVMNGYGNAGYPSMKVISADEYWVTPGEFDSCNLVTQQAITWSPSFNTGDELPDWDLPYRTVATANTVLAVLADIPTAHQLAKWQGIHSAACFFRGFAFFELAQLFAPAYDTNDARNALGIPLPLSPDINQKIFRTTVQQTYDQILSDLHEAGNVAPKDASWMPTRPSKAAVYAMFARVYLSMRNYSQALLYADSSIQQQPELMLYDTIPDQFLPFKRWNPEVIFAAAYYRNGPAALLRSHVDSGLLQSYQPGDLRKTLFFPLGDYFLGTYDEEGYCFMGLSSPEMYLTRSECQVRLGNTAAAMASLNYLLQTRWTNGAFTPYTATDADDALKQILLERRKELIFRGVRWTDLRRLNKDPKTAQSISRTVNGNTYTLPYNDDRWVLPIPGYVLDFNPGMPQNIR